MLPKNLVYVLFTKYVEHDGKEMFFLSKVHGQINYLDTKAKCCHFKGAQA